MGLTKEIIGGSLFQNFKEFNEAKANFYDDDGSLLVPSFKLEDPSSYFISEEFEREINKLKEEFDYVICDTPPWKLFVDAKIVSKYFENQLFIVCNQETSFKDPPMISFVERF